ncbi:MAG: HEAT repeat domain-containing protein [Methanomicrobiaceae archaeon]|nr:HEAT repeat domain-containing protein [Methanomicrobiaceae archaeon]
MPVGKEPEQQDVGALVEALLGKGTYNSLQAAAALGRIGAPAVDPLVRTFADTGTNARWRVAMALARVGTPAVEALIDVVNTQEDSARHPAVWALAEIGDQRAVEPLIAALKTGRTECCRALSAAALLKLGHPDGVTAVEDEFLSGDEIFRDVVYEAQEGT